MTDTADRNDVVRQIARSPALRAEAVEVAPRLDHRQRPMSPEQIIAQLVALVPIYGVGQRSEQEWATFWEAYLKALAGLPWDALAEAIVEFNRNPVSYFPRPGQLYPAADRHAKQIRTAAWRCKKAAAFIESHPPRRPRPTPEEIAAVRRMADEFNGRAVHRPADPPESL